VTVLYKKLSLREETVLLLRGSVLANCYDWKTTICGHYVYFQLLWRNRPAKISNSVK